MYSRETLLLRTKLRQVNMEYSALVRDGASERRFVRMDELRLERRALMYVLFDGAHSNRRPLVSRSDVALSQAASRAIVEFANDVPLRPTSSKHSERVSS